MGGKQDEGFKEMHELVAFYKENATILRKTFNDLGFSVYGGENAPYVWVGFPGKPSWEVFAEILERCNIVTTPGSGFGPAGEGFVRASAFGHRSAAAAAAATVFFRAVCIPQNEMELLASLCMSRL